MPNVTNMQKEFDALLKKYEGAVKTLEWNHASRNVNLTENMNARAQEIKGFKKRFDAAVAEPTV